MFFFCLANYVRIWKNTREKVNSRTIWVVGIYLCTELFLHQKVWQWYESSSVPRSSFTKVFTEAAIIWLLCDFKHCLYKSYLLFEMLPTHES